MFSNLLLATDSYKHSHFLQAPPNTSKCYHYLEARSSKNFPEVTFFGLQYLLEQLTGTAVFTQDIDEAEQICALHGITFNKAGWEDALAYAKSKLGNIRPALGNLRSPDNLKEENRICQR